MESIDECYSYVHLIGISFVFMFGFMCERHWSIFTRQFAPYKEHIITIIIITVIIIIISSIVVIITIIIILINVIIIITVVIIIITIRGALKRSLELASLPGLKQKYCKRETRNPNSQERFLKMPREANRQLKKQPESIITHFYFQILFFKKTQFLNITCLSLL